MDYASKDDLRIQRNFAERKRRHAIKVTFHNLYEKIPNCFKTSILERMTKLRTLRYAIKYIRFLYYLLEQSKKK